MKWFDYFVLSAIPCFLLVLAGFNPYAVAAGLAAMLALLLVLPTLVPAQARTQRTVYVFVFAGGWSNA